jgi:hypothetical protein
MSTLQTARTTPQDQGDFGLSVGMVNRNIEKDNSNSSIGFYPVIESTYRVGLSNKSDFGLKLTYYGYKALIPSIDYKRILIGDNYSKYCLSSGVAISNIFWLGLTNNILYNLMLPVYFSYYPNEYFSYYCSPKFLIISEYVIEGPVSERYKYKWSYQTGITNGVCIGAESKFLIEHTIYLIKDKMFPYNMINIGYIYRF